MNELLPKRLRELRKENKYTQEEMAKKLGVTTSAYGFYEQGRIVPDTLKILELANMFNVTTDYFFVCPMIHVELPHKNIFITLYNKRLRKITSLALFYTINNIAHNTPIPKYAIRPATSKIILFMADTSF